MANPTGDVSVIVPVLNDDRDLARLLEHLAAEHPRPLEVIVVDGADDAHCTAVCRKFGARRLQTAAGRGHQLNVGAAATRGDVLWFLHADALPPEQCISLIERTMMPGVVGGFFRFRFAGPVTWYKNALQWLINLRTQIGIPYGDQGLFAERNVFFAVGGFAEAPLFEEVPLVRGLRRAGTFRNIDASIGVSCRRWERDGWLRRSLANRLLALGYALGITPEVLARRYDRRC